ncbi:uncharacterized protein EDB93DRAFT_1255423 [Suillus bovinus]|uniref:uncharacterized protein n=1 Tax=Suillus bovinus TaxID=48563 RepID=UPI001B8711D7|nr:uncharacterized protein EDB93DRAFT_1255423 [Suillus bovinus]KAG2131728.1 hypothetical protein EDB93DRAFT_1255423 [Suillus bovinus]
MASPDLKLELLEDQEMWMCEWRSIMHTDDLGIDLDMEDKDMEMLKQGRKAHRDIEGLVISVEGDAGVPHRGGCISVPKAEKCAACESWNIKYGGAPGERCPPCTTAKCTCMFAGKHKNSDAPKARPCKPLLKCSAAGESAKETASSVAVEEALESEESDMDVEIVGEHNVSDLEIRTPAAMPECAKPARAAGPLASGSVPKEKGKEIDVFAQLEESHANNACLEVENAHLHGSLLEVHPAGGPYPGLQQAFHHVPGVV